MYPPAARSSAWGYLPSMWLMLAACTDLGSDGPRPVYDEDGGHFFDTPWPADRRLDEDGTIDLTEFPNPYQSALIEDYLAFGEAQVGFGTSSPIYLGLDGPLDALLMPTPRESLEEGSALVLADIDPDSAHFGERFPIEWEQWRYDRSLQAPEHLLAVAPMHGFPLRPHTTYALILTTGVARPSDAWLQDWAEEPELDHALFFLGLRRDDVAIATIFTTSDPLDEMRRIAWFVRDRVGPPPVEYDLEREAGHVTYTAWRTHYMSPVFTFGDPPYLSTGGGFEFEEDGTPKVARFDDLRLAVCTPNDQPAPPSGWPVVIFQHGTGGDYRDFCDSDAAFEAANRFGERGIVGLGIDQPLHGNRPGASSASDLTHFNIVNPASGLSNFRQGAADAIYLAHGLAREPWTFHADGEEFRTDPDRVLFMGHSQGGLTGAIATPFFGDDVKASMISGAGGVLSITIVERTDPLDFASLVRELIDLQDGEPLTPLHPVIGVVQTLAEVTDPVNYAPYWFSQRGGWDWQAPVPVLLTNGTLDSNTPYSTAVALAAAARLPFVGAAASRADAVRMRVGEPQALPCQLDGLDYEGGRNTSGFEQFLDGSHWVVFEEQPASDLAVNFLESTADGRGALWSEGERP
jgi:hypothetical protein